MTIKITTKVGKGQPNFNAGDNIAVQNLLNKFIQAGRLTGLAPLLPDGQVGSKTIAAVTKFQRDIVGFKNPDSFVSPGGTTLATLNGPLTSSGKSPLPDNNSQNENVDATPSTEWGLLCVSYQKYLLALELLNIKTDRAHRLIFSGAGTDTIQETSEWLLGKHYQRFDTKFPANFDNFNNVSTMLTPQSSYPGITHIMKIGLLATVNIPHPPGKPFGEWNLYGTSKIIYGSGARSKLKIYEPIYRHNY